MTKPEAAVVKLGFADAVMRHGDEWRTNAYLDAFDRGEKSLGNALLLSDGTVSDDYQDFLLMIRLAKEKK